MINIPFTPLFARVLLKRPINKTYLNNGKPSAILIADGYEKKNAPEEGILIAVGHTADESLKELIGQKVTFAKHSGAWTKIKDDEYFMCQDEDLLGVVYE